MTPIVGVFFLFENPFYPSITLATTKKPFFLFGKFSTIICFSIAELSITTSSLKLLTDTQLELTWFAALSLDGIAFLITSNNNTVNNVHHNCVSVSDLREDVVIASSAIEKQLIIENFASKKNGFLVVAKVIEG